MEYLPSTIWKRRTDGILRFIDSESRKGTNQIGFIQRDKVRWLAEHGQAGIVEENRDPAGFVLHGRTPPDLRIYQVWMRSDARRHLYATLMLQHVEWFARIQRCRRITLRCATDLAAIDFWLAIGFSIANIDNTRNARQRTVTTFSRSINALTPLGSFA